MGKKRQSTQDMEDEDEEYDNAKEDSKGKLLNKMSRIKAIAKQDPDVGGLSNGAVAAINAATQGLLEKLLLGAAKEARAKAESKSSSSSSSRGTAKSKSAGGVVTIAPEDIQAFILNNDELQFLRSRVEETQASGYLESYRARVREVTKASSKKSLKALVGGALGGGEGEEDEEEEEDEDEAVESAAAAAAAAVAVTEEGAGGGGGAAAAAAQAGKAKSMVLDENYGGEDY